MEIRNSIIINQAPKAYQEVLGDAEEIIYSSRSQLINGSIDTPEEVWLAAYLMAIVESEFLGNTVPTVVLDCFQINTRDFFRDFSAEEYSIADNYLRNQLRIMTYAEEKTPADTQLMKKLMTKIFSRTTEWDFEQDRDYFIEPREADDLAEKLVKQPYITKETLLKLDLLDSKHDYVLSNPALIDLISTDGGSTITLDDLEAVLNDPQKIALKNFLFDRGVNEYFRDIKGIPYVFRRDDPHNRDWFFSCTNLLNNSDLRKEIEGGLFNSAKLNNKVFLVGRISTRGYGKHDYTIIDAETNKVLMVVAERYNLTFSYSEKDDMYCVTGKTLDGRSGTFNMYTGELIESAPNNLEQDQESKENKE